MKELWQHAGSPEKAGGMSCGDTMQMQWCWQRGAVGQRANGTSHLRAKAHATFVEDHLEDLKIMCSYLDQPVNTSELQGRSATWEGRTTAMTTSRQTWVKTVMGPQWAYCLVRSGEIHPTLTEYRILKNVCLSNSLKINGMEST